jgi:hypothetical protein
MTTISWERDRNPFKSSDFQKSGETMGKESDRDKKYMFEKWGTTKLATDYQCIFKKRHNFEIQNRIHQNIRNDDDYDDWEYGTEPTYGKNLNK